jgi:glycosyltransferase involved in cell wall biosynthesis
MMARRRLRRDGTVAEVERVVVTVDACELDTASRYRGIGTYLREVLGRLALRDDLEIRALTSAPDTLPSGVHPVLVRRRLPRRFRTREHDVRLPRELRRAGGDVVWSPAHDPPARASAPVVQMLHDATPLVWPHPDMDAAARRMRRLLPRYRAADAWIAQSEHTADSCAAVMGLPRERITVAHLGVDGRFRPPPSPRGAPGHADPYVLYVGEYGPHKGFAEAFAVAAALARRGLPHRLRMVGRIAPWWQPAIDGLLIASECPERVELSGFVDDLVATYQGASALIATSRQEGFGLPLVEAMACAIPVVAFANSAMTEVVERGGVLVTDGDVDAMADALEPLLTDERTWHDASIRAAQRAEDFDWERTADTHAEVLRSSAVR